MGELWSEPPKTLSVLRLVLSPILCPLGTTEAPQGSERSHSLHPASTSPRLSAPQWWEWGGYEKGANRAQRLGLGWEEVRGQDGKVWRVGEGNRLRVAAEPPWSPLPSPSIPPLPHHPIRASGSGGPEGRAGCSEERSISETKANFFPAAVVMWLPQCMALQGGSWVGGDPAC